MYFLIYSSYAKDAILESDLKAILVQSRKNNKILNITGMLLFFQKRFMQLIEGDEQEIRQLYEVIKNDERHADVITLKEGHIEKRFFEDWSMGFKAISKEELANEENYKDLSKSGPATTAAFKIFKILSGSNEK